MTVKHALPRIDLKGMIVLDVGCGDGRDLLHPEFSAAKALYGVDINAPAIHSGKSKYPKLNLSVSGAEKLPFDAAHFDAIMSRVALPYTNIPVALTEIHRALKPGGYLFLTMHDWKMQFRWIKAAIKDRAWKRVIDHAYIVPASAIYAMTGRCIARPWNGLTETFQTQHRLRKDLISAGFNIERMERQSKHLEIEAVKA